MRKRTAILLITLLLAFSVSLTAPAYCADCSGGGAVDSFCNADADNVYGTCCAAFGCSNPVSERYCYSQFKGAYNGCVTSLGCPGLAY